MFSSALKPPIRIWIKIIQCLAQAIHMRRNTAFVGVARETKNPFFP